LEKKKKNGKKRVIVYTDLSVHPRTTGEGAEEGNMYQTRKKHSFRVTGMGSAADQAPVKLKWGGGKNRKKRTVRGEERESSQATNTNNIKNLIGVVHGCWAEVDGLRFGGHAKKLSPSANAFLESKVNTRGKS